MSRSSMAGANGSSYFRSVPRTRSHGRSSSPAGTSRATVRPRFVMVMDSPSWCTRSMSARHLALNSAAGDGLHVTSLNDQFGRGDPGVAGPNAYGVSPQVLAGVVRICTHPKIYRQTSPLAEALAYCRVLLEPAHSTLIQPGDRHWSIFTDLCESADVSGNLVPDAWFAALAIEHGCQWISTDPDYGRFQALQWQRPQAHPPAGSYGCHSDDGGFRTHVQYAHDPDRRAPLCGRRQSRCSSVHAGGPPAHAGGRSKRGLPVRQLRGGRCVDDAHDGPYAREPQIEVSSGSAAP